MTRLGAAWLFASLAVGCGDDGGTGGAPPSDPAWQVVFEAGDLDRAAVSVWGASSGDVWVVGGPFGNSGFEALALRHRAGAWSAPDVGGERSFWWVSGAAADDVWLVGEAGRITHFDGAGFTEHESGTTATLWGAIAFAPDDAWAVGGTPGGAGDEPDDVVLRWDGVTWQPQTLPGEPLGRALFKVWGTSSDELFVVGEYGVIWRRRGGAWELASEPPLATGNLTTVHGCAADDVWAVGGRDVLHFDGQAWSRVEVALTNDVNGVACRAGRVALVGGGGLKRRRDASGVWSDDFAAPPHGDLHGVHIDDAGAIWGVGGAFLAGVSPGAPRDGIVTRYAPDRIDDTPPP